MFKYQKYKGYIGRDENGMLNLFLNDKPWKTESEIIGQSEWTNETWDGMPISDNGTFQDVKWEDEEPTQVIITIEKIN